jgi:chemotaxis protein MotB
VFDQQAGGIINGPKKVSKEPSPLTSKDEEQTLVGLAAALKKKFSTRPEFSKYKDQIKIEMTEQGLRIQILDKAERVSFSSGSSELTPDAKSILEEIGHAICQLPNPLLIGGHTDRHLFPPDSTYTNWELSADRANAARRALEASCVKPEQIRRIVGYADTELLIPEDPYAMANRRISITVMKLAGQDPTDIGNNDGHAQTKGDSPPVIEAALPNVKPGSTESAAKPPAGRKDVPVGTADELPRNVKRSKEAPSRPAAPVGQ